MDLLIKKIEKQISLSKKIQLRYIDNVGLIFQMKRLIFNKPIYHRNNRYYIPLIELVIKLGGSVKFDEDRINLQFSRKCVSLRINDIAHKIALKNNDIYLTLIDIVSILNINTRWDYNKNNIVLYSNNNDTIYAKGRNNKKCKTALIRFEDISAGNPYLSSENLEKTRIIANYMYLRGFPFNVSWIPRYINPPMNIDNDLLNVYSIENADFIFTLDYIINRNGNIGLHGYTHQNDNEVTGMGNEFDRNHYMTDESIRKRIEQAIKTAILLEMPFKFFESPHYEATEYQQSIIEQYFNCIYEPYKGNKKYENKIIKSFRNHNTVYIPTPLGYVSKEDGINKMLFKIKEINKGVLASLFFHPFLEFEYITLNKIENNIPSFMYSSSSMLHKIINCLEEKNYVPANMMDVIRYLK